MYLLIIQFVQPTSLIILINYTSAEQSKHEVSITPLAPLHKCQWSVLAIGTSVFSSGKVRSLAISALMSCKFPCIPSGTKKY